MIDPLNPLSEQHYTAIVNGIELAKAAIAAADKAALAGIDLSATKKQAEDALDKLSRVRNVYFPGR